MANPKCTPELGAWMRRFNGFYRLESVARDQASKSASRPASPGAQPPTGWLSVEVDAARCAVSVTGWQTGTPAWRALPNAFELGERSTRGTLTPRSAVSTVTTDSANPAADGSLELRRTVTAPLVQVGPFTLWTTEVASASMTLSVKGDGVAEARGEERVADGKTSPVETVGHRKDSEE